jgi:DNA modification methylase
MKPYFCEDGITIYHGDCREVLPCLAPVDLVVTSPPYMDLRVYNGRSVEWGEIPAALAVCRLQDSGQMLVNLGLVCRDGSVIEYWSALRSSLEAEGMKLAGWYVWDKTYGAPGDWDGRLAPAHEFIFHFRRRARQLNKTARCTYAGLVKKRTQRNQDGSFKEFTGTGPVQEFKVPDSVFRIVPQRDGNAPETEHPAIFPHALPAELISTFSSPGELLLDPYVGSGTTLFAAKRLGRRAIGIEIEERYCEIAAKRLAQKVLFGVGK